MVDVQRPLMEPGRVVATPAALDALEKAGAEAGQFVHRHLCGDWGDDGTYAETTLTERERAHGAFATDEPAKLNALAVDAADGSRVMSTYTLGTGEKIWISTQGTGMDRYTSVFLPSEY